MSYRIDACDPAPQTPGDTASAATIVLVGCGGTGGFVAEGLARLLIGKAVDLCFVDMDRVEPHNLTRQAFEPQDAGRFKAQVLAERLTARLGRAIGYSVLPYDGHIHAEIFNRRGRLKLIIGCVDNAPARRAIMDTLSPYTVGSVTGRAWWLDAGNGRNGGQILLGNALRAEELRGAFDRTTGVCRALPAPGLQRPDLLAAPPPSELPADCAAAVTAGTQGPTINQIMAAFVLSYVEHLLAGTCAWMSTYLDMDAGLIRTVYAEPHTIARLTGLHPNAIAPAARQR